MTDSGKDLLINILATLQKLWMHGKAFTLTQCVNLLSYTLYKNVERENLLNNFRRIV